MHASTGNTRHYVDGALMEKPSALRIARYPNSLGYYLRYLDEEGREQTDTYHQTVADAHHQAAFEFGVQPHEWTVLNREQSDA